MLRDQHLTAFVDHTETNHPIRISRLGRLARRVRRRFWTRRWQFIRISREWCTIRIQRLRQTVSTPGTAHEFGKTFRAQGGLYRTVLAGVLLHILPVDERLIDQGLRELPFNHASSDPTDRDRSQDARHQQCKGDFETQAHGLPRWGGNGRRAFEATHEEREAVGCHIRIGSVGLSDAVGLVQIAHPETNSCASQAAVVTAFTPDLTRHELTSFLLLLQAAFAQTYGETSG